MCAYVKTFIKLCDAQVIKNMYILIKIPAVFFAENDKLILTSIWEIQGIQNSQNTFGKKKTNLKDSDQFQNLLQL